MKKKCKTCNKIKDASFIVVEGVIEVFGGVVKKKALGYISQCCASLTIKNVIK